MSEGWALVLDPSSADPRRVVAGLPVALRLALDAQAGGAAAVLVPAVETDVRAALNDARLRIPVLEAAEPTLYLVRVPRTWVVHRGLFKALAADMPKNPGAYPRNLASEPFSIAAPYAFEPLDVPDAAAAARAERLLFRALRKPEDGWTSRYLNRYISLAISRYLVRTPLTPNQVSVGILAIGLFGAYLATRGGYASLLAGAALFQAQSVLDGCDGEMSRVTYRGSRAGEWLDTVGDDLTNYSFFTGAAWGLYRTSTSPVYLALGTVIVLSGFIASGLEYRYLIRIGSGDLLRYPLSQGKNTGAFALIQPLFKRDTFVFMTLLAATLGALGPMLYVFAAGALGILFNVFRTELRLAREARANASGVGG